MNEPIIIKITITPKAGAFDVDVFTENAPDITDDSPTYVLFADIVNTEVRELMDKIARSARRFGADVQE